MTTGCILSSSDRRDWWSFLERYIIVARFEPSSHVSDILNKDSIINLIVEDTVRDNIRG